MIVNGTKADDLVGVGLVTKQRYQVPLWVSLVGVVGVFVARAVAQVVVWLARHWRVSVPGGVTVGAYVVGGWLGVTALVSGVLAVGLVWARRWPASFSWHVGQKVRGSWRWQARYRRGWFAAMDGTGLTRTTPSRVVYLPRVVDVRSSRVVDTITVRLLHGQTPADVAAAAEGLRHVFEAHRCTVAEVGPGLVRLVFYGRDPLRALVPAIEPPASGRDVDLAGLHVGRAEDGQPYRLRLLGRHILIAGATGAGKGSALWSPIRALAPAVAAGLVDLYGIDPKRLELVFARALFTRLEDKHPEQMVELLEDLVERMQARQEVMSGHSRDHTATPDSPAVVVVIDELASLTAYATDRDLKKRTEAALSMLLSQGRAVGFYVIAALQDPRKDVVQFRDLFPVRIALRTTEAAHADMILGEGALDRGAACHLIPDSMPGVGYVHVEGAHEPVRVRFAYVTDADLRAMNDTYPATGNGPARVLDLTGAPVPGPRTKGAAR